MSDILMIDSKIVKFIVARAFEIAVILHIGYNMQIRKKQPAAES